jgi:3'(2'), 5'-bisphosphate nucleotidase
MMRNKNILKAVEAALSAGKEILSVYDTAFTVDIKHDRSPLTLADKKAHSVIVALLESTGLPILSEEGKEIPFDQRKAWDMFWMVDPLDGTKEFVKRNGEFTVNIALVEQGEPTAGVIYVPVSDVLYLGVKGSGSVKVAKCSKMKLTDLETVYANGQTLPIATEDRPYSVVGSRSHMTDDTAVFVAQLKKEHGLIDMVSIGSSIKLCLVAEGVADIYPRFAPTMEWDTAAGHAIAAAAGCEVTGQDGITPLRYNKENLVNPWFIVKR